MNGVRVTAGLAKVTLGRACGHAGGARRLGWWSYRPMSSVPAQESACTDFEEILTPSGGVSPLQPLPLPGPCPGEATGHPHLSCAPWVEEALLTEARHNESEDAFVVVDLSHVEAQVGLWKSHLPRVRPFFAVKANPDPRIMAVLHSLGCGFDCASVPEVAAALKIGACPVRDIVYANPCKAPSHLSQAAADGVDLMTLDSTDEVAKIGHLHPGARCLIRLFVDDSASRCTLGNKFGAQLSDIPRLLAAARRHGVAIDGVSFHVGSECLDPCAFTNAVGVARHAIDVMSSFGVRSTIVDIGGGFPSNPALFAPIATALSCELDHQFPALSFPHVRFIGEPGRFLVADGVTLATNVIGRRVVEPTVEDDEHHVMYFLNDGIYGSFNCLLHDHATAVPRVLLQDGRVPSQFACPPHPSSSLWGPTCDGLDCIIKDSADLPSLDVGDWLAFEGWGAYTVAAATTFNGFSVPERRYVTC